MSENWVAVSQAINERLAELGLNQRELIERSRVSKGVVSQLMRNVTPQPRRSARTLEALSSALDWHPQHLSALLAGREPPGTGEPVYRPDDVPARLAAIERQLGEITDRLDELRSIREQLNEVREAVLPNRDGVSR